MKNKNLLITINVTFYMLLFTFNSIAQNVGINSNGTTPHSSALLDLSSNDKGFLITRADTANIANPAFGLMTLAPADSCLYMYSGMTWISIGGVGYNCPCGESSPPSVLDCGNEFTDARDNKTYGIIGIGNQCWMKENLAYLPSVVGPSTGSAMNETDPYYYVYGYDGTNVVAAKNHINYTTYGVLYNWFAAMNGANPSEANPSGVQGVCPTGWHLPSDSEWKELEMHLGMSQAHADLEGDNRGTNQGSQLKDQSFGGTNSSGFSALPGGRRMHQAYFLDLNNMGFWWTTSVEDYPVPVNGMSRYLYAPSTVSRGLGGMGSGLSVRCVKD